MNARIAAAALLSAASTFSLPAQAQGVDPCTQIIVYAVQQFCSLMPNGQSLCQPVALTGPSPACQVPAPPQFKPVPLAPPSFRFPAPNPMAAPVATPFMVPVPFAPMAAPAPSPYLAAPISPFAAQPVSPFAGQPFAPRPGLPLPAMPVPVMPLPAAQPPAQPIAPASDPAPQAADTPAPAEPAPAVQTAAPSDAAPATVPEAPPQTPPAAAVPAPSADTPAQPAQSAQAETAPEPVVANLPDAPSLPAVVAEAVALFPFDSAELTPLGMETLDSWHASAPVGMPVVVYGYADRLGPESYNQGLSQRRADAARTYLIGKGKDSRDIRAQGKGEANPVKHCKGGPTQTTIDCLAPNRRVHIIPE